MSRSRQRAGGRVPLSSAAAGPPGPLAPPPAAALPPRAALGSPEAACLPARGAAAAPGGRRGPGSEAGSEAGGRLMSTWLFCRRVSRIVLSSLSKCRESGAYKPPCKAEYGVRVVFTPNAHSPCRAGFGWNLHVSPKADRPARSVAWSLPWAQVCSETPTRPWRGQWNMHLGPHCSPRNDPAAPRVRPRCGKGLTAGDRRLRDGRRGRASPTCVNGAGPTDPASPSWRNRAGSSSSPAREEGPGVQPGGADAGTRGHAFPVCVCARSPHRGSRVLTGHGHPGSRPARGRQRCPTSSTKQGI